MFVEPIFFCFTDSVWTAKNIWISYTQKLAIAFINETVIFKSQTFVTFINNVNALRKFNLEKYSRLSRVTVCMTSLRPTYGKGKFVDMIHDESLADLYFTRLNAEYHILTYLYRYNFVSFFT